MSAIYKNAKKKQLQDELRRYMNDHKRSKLLQKSMKRVESPLAKYSESGELTCILCRAHVRSEAVWPVHVNSKQHRQNVELAKTLKNSTNNFTQQPLKRPLTPPSPASTGPSKKLKSILINNGQAQTKQLSVSTIGGSSSSSSGESVVEQPSGIDDARQMVEDETATTSAYGPVPEGFFDDPRLDAKARNQEYKDPVEEEWDRFQREIREANTFSATIIAEDQEESTAGRQIDEIDEQMRNLSKVLDFARRKVELAESNVTQHQQLRRNAEDENEIDDSDQSDIDDFLDWRSKKSFR